jgi:hypothetical protein
MHGWCTACRVSSWNESPHAHEPEALGLSMVKPCFSMVSTKSIVAPLKYRGAHPVGHHGDPGVVLGDVTVEAAVVEEELVAQSGAPARLDGNPQGQVVATLRIEQRAYLADGRLVSTMPSLVDVWTVVVSADMRNPSLKPVLAVYRQSQPAGTRRHSRCQRSGGQWPA